MSPLFIFGILLVCFCIVPRPTMEWCARWIASLSSRSYLAGWVRNLRAKKEEKKED